MALFAGLRAEPGRLPGGKRRDRAARAGAASRRARLAPKGKRVARRSDAGNRKIWRPNLPGMANKPLKLMAVRIIKIRLIASAKDPLTLSLSPRGERTPERPLRLVLGVPSPRPHPQADAAAKDASSPRRAGAEKDRMRGDFAQGSVSSRRAGRRAGVKLAMTQGCDQPDAVQCANGRERTQPFTKSPFLREGLAPFA